MLGINKGDKKRKKRVYWGYSLLDYKGMEAYFEKMAKEGWMLEKIGEVWATFYEATPQNLQFTIDIFEGSGILTPEKTEEAKEYRDLCEENGWYFVTSIKELQIFYAPGEEDLTPIQTDEDLEENLVQNKLWKKDFGLKVMVLFITLGLVIFSRFRASIHMDEYVGNMIYFVYPLMLIPALLSVIRSGLWIRKIKHHGLPDKEVESFFTGRRRQLLIDTTATLIFLVLVIGIVLDSLYNPHAEILSVMFPPLLGMTVGTVLRYLIRLKGRKKDDGIIFIIVGFLIIFMILGGVNYFRNQQIEQRLNERDRDQNIIEEIPEGVEAYSIGNLLFSTEEVTLKRRTFPIKGQSFAVPNYYTQQETWEVDNAEWGITIKTYETRNTGIAEIITEGYLDFQLGGIITYLGESWVEKANLKETWNVESFYMTESYPAILIQKEERVWVIQGSYNNTRENHMKEWESKYEELHGKLAETSMYEEEQEIRDEIDKLLKAGRREEMEKLEALNMDVLIEELLR